MSVVLRLAAGLTLVLGLLVFLPVIDTLGTEVFVTLDASTNILYVTLIKVIIGFIGFAIAISGFWDIVGPQTPTR